MVKVKTKLSIRKLIFLIFIISLFISVTSYGIVIFANWMSSARKTAELIAADVNESIYNQVYLFMQAPNKVNEQSQKIIANGMLDLADEKQRDRFFVGTLEAQRNEIFSFSYGTAEGEYYGARSNENGDIEIMRNNVATGGNSWYYSVAEDSTAGELVVQAGKFDPRSRAL